MFNDPSNSLQRQKHSLRRSYAISADLMSQWKGVASNTRPAVLQSITDANTESLCTGGAGPARGLRIVVEGENVTRAGISTLQVPEWHEIFLHKHAQVHTLCNHHCVRPDDLRRHQLVSRS